MNTKEILDYAFLGVTFTGISYISLIASSIFADKFSKKIESEEELTAIIEKESKKLGLEDINIKGYFKDECSQAVYYGENKWEIWLSPYGKTHSTVRHEMYHVKRSTKKNKFPPIPSWDYLFNEEPRSIIYEVFRLRL